MNIACVFALTWTLVYGTPWRMSTKSVTTDLCGDMLSAGLFPVSDSFDLLQEEYIRSMGLNDTFINGFSSNVQTYFLNNIRMGYCTQSGEVTCADGTNRTMICKIPCK